MVFFNIYKSTFGVLYIETFKNSSELNVRMIPFPNRTLTVMLHVTVGGINLLKLKATEFAITALCVQSSITLL